MLKIKIVLLTFTTHSPADNHLPVSILYAREHIAIMAISDPDQFDPISFELIIRLISTTFTVVPIIHDAICKCKPKHVFQALN